MLASALFLLVGRVFYWYQGWIILKPMKIFLLRDMQGRYHTSLRYQQHGNRNSGSEATRTIAYTLYQYCKVL